MAIKHNRATHLHVSCAISSDWWKCWVQTDRFGASHRRTPRWTVHRQVRTQGPAVIAFNGSSTHPNAGGATYADQVGACKSVRNRV